MILHPALGYVIRRRWTNRVRGWLRKLRTPAGALGGVLFLVLAGVLAFGTGIGDTMPMATRIATFVSVLAFFMVVSILSGIGQRGLVFLNADIDFVFPAPIARRHVLLYHFAPHYLAAALMAVTFVLAFGGRHLPHPGLFMLGFFLVQVLCAHLGALSAELSMVLGDQLYRKLRRASTVLLVLATVAGMLLLIGGLSHTGDVPGRLRGALETPLAQVIFYPAVKAVHLGAHPDAAVRWGALGILGAFAAGSFALVVLLRVDFVEASFHATRKAWKKVHQMRRGVHDASVRRSASRPRSRGFRGSGAVLWLNALTMRRQLRTMIGGLLVVFVMLAVFSGQRGGRSLAHTLLVMLGLVPLWMPLPIGFRLPREQLLALRELPLPSTPLAAALVTVPVLVPLLLQTFAVLVLMAVGDLEPALALAVVPAYAAAGVTLVAIESFFVLRRPHPNAVNLVHALLQVVLQFVALLPGLVLAALLTALHAPLPGSLLLAALAQGVAAACVLQRLGRRLQRGEIATA